MGCYVRRPFTLQFYVVNVGTKAVGGVAQSGGDNSARRRALHRVWGYTRPVLRPAEHLSAQRPAFDLQPVPVQRWVVGGG